MAEGKKINDVEVLDVSAVVDGTLYPVYDPNRPTSAARSSAQQIANYVKSKVIADAAHASEQEDTDQAKLASVGKVQEMIGDGRRVEPVTVWPATPNTDIIYLALGGDSGNNFDPNNDGIGYDVSAGKSIRLYYDGDAWEQAVEDVQGSGGGAELETAINSTNPSANKTPSSAAVVNFVNGKMDNKLDKIVIAEGDSYEELESTYDTYEKYISSSGNIVNIASLNYHVVGYPVDEGEKYFITGHTHATSALAVYKDQNGATLSVLNGSGPFNHDFTRLESTAPAGAAMLYIGATRQVAIKLETKVKTTIDNQANIAQIPAIQSTVNTIQSTVNTIQSTVNENEKKAPSILLIGSSHGMNSISQVPWILHYGGLKETRVGNVYVGSFQIEELAYRVANDINLSYQEFNEDDNPAWGKSRNNYYLFDQLLAKQWDVIILQRSASDDETWSPSQSSSMRYIVNRIASYYKNHNIRCPRIMMNSGFADSVSDVAGGTHTHTNAIISTCEEACEELGIEIIPTATAIANARETWLNTLGSYTYKYLCYDSQHLDYGIGCWIASACIVESVLRPLGGSISSMSGYGTLEQQHVFNVLVTTETYTEPTEKMLTIARACAIAAVNNHTVSENLGDCYKNKNNINLYVGRCTISGNNANAKTIASGSSWSITLTPFTNHVLNSVTVLHGDIDVTETAYDSSTHTISIDSVSGDITVMAEATQQ